MDDAKSNSLCPARVVALVVGCLLLLPGLATLVGGSVLGLGYAFGRDSDGFSETSLDRFASETVAVTAEEFDCTVDPGTPGWVVDAVEADVRLRVTGASSEGELFVGIGPEVAVDAYLSGVAHDEVRSVEGDTPEFRNRTGGEEIALALPGKQDFWMASASGPGTQELLWEGAEGRWAVVLMHADATTGAAAAVDVDVRADAVLSTTDRYADLPGGLTRSRWTTPVLNDDMLARPKETS